MNQHGTARLVIDERRLPIPSHQALTGEDRDISAFSAGPVVRAHLYAVQSRTCSALPRQWTRE